MNVLCLSQASCMLANASSDRTASGPLIANHQQSGRYDSGIIQVEGIKQHANYTHKSQVGPCWANVIESVI